MPIEITILIWRNLQWTFKWRSSEVLSKKIISREKKEWQEGKLTNRTEVEEERQFPSAGQAGVGLAQLVEEGVCTCLQGRQPGHRRVFQQSRAESDGLWWGTRFKHLKKDIQQNYLGLCINVYWREKSH